MKPSSTWQILLLGSQPILSSAALNKTRSCLSSAFRYPEIPGARVLGLSAKLVQDFAFNATANGDIPAANIVNLNFCNVTVEYTHIGQNDTIHMTTWLPLAGWNGRFQGAGGGGFATGYPDTSHPVPVHQGFAVGSTDGGHYGTNPEAWALKSPGEVDVQLLEDFAYLALHELAIVGKFVAESFYGRLPKYSYWNGCSTGGRQGLMLAQRYPGDFDGIVALSPAINWPTFIVAEYWPQFVMNQLGVYPPTCEFDTITAAAIAACDGLDGVIDGVISAPGLCNFNPQSLVGRASRCVGTNKTVSTAAAMIAEEAWKGPFAPNGTREWFGLTQDTNLSSLAGTNCTTTTPSGLCTSGAPFPIAQEWISLFVLEDPSANLVNLTVTEYSNLFQTARDKYQKLIGTADPDLSRFHNLGHKMVTWHGLADPLIFHNGTNQYYDNVLKRDRSVRDYYRYFVAPGTAHCSPGAGPYPTGALQAVMDWVEAGVAPETLNAVSTNKTSGLTTVRKLCPYPLVSKYVGGNPEQDALFVCAPSF